MEITKELLRACINDASEANLVRFTEPINLACQEFSITTLQRVAAFLAQITVESNSLSATRENLNYSMSGLRTVFAKYFSSTEVALNYARQPEKIANRVYALRGGNGDTTSGDGWKYRGAGLIQTTLKDNFAATGKALNLDLINHPELLELPINAARSAAWYFWEHSCNTLADADNIDGITYRINRAMLNRDKRKELYEHNKLVLNNFL